MVREPPLIGGLNMLVSYTRFHRNYQAESSCLQIFPRSHQFHSYPHYPPPLCLCVSRPLSLQAFRASSSLRTSSSSSSCLKSISKPKCQLLVDRPIFLLSLPRGSAAITFSSECDSTVAVNVITDWLRCGFTTSLTAVKCCLIASDGRGQ